MKRTVLAVKRNVAKVTTPILLLKISALRGLTLAVGVAEEEEHLQLGVERNRRQNDLERIEGNRRRDAKIEYMNNYFQDAEI